MYSEERTAWWLGRSSTEGHRQAYDLIAEYIPKATGSVLVDMACGPGEMLKRTAAKGYALVIGSDASLAMLEAARQNLSRASIEARIESDFSRIIAHQGAVLVRDDALESKLPSEVADVVLLTFPDIGCEYTPQKEDHGLLERYCEITGESVQDKNRDRVIRKLRINQQLARVARKKGHIFTVSYFASRRNFSQRERRIIDETGRIARITDLELQASTFIESSDVFADTETTPERIRRELGCDRRDVRTGFMIWKYAKKS